MVNCDFNPVPSTPEAAQISLHRTAFPKSAFAAAMAAFELGLITTALNPGIRQTAPHPPPKAEQRHELRGHSC